MTLAFTSDSQRLAEGALSVALALTVLIKFFVPLGSSNSVTIITIATFLAGCAGTENFSCFVDLAFG